MLPWEEKFFHNLRKTGNVDLAATAAGVHRTTVYHHRENRPVFRKRWDTAIHVYRQTNTSRVTRRIAIV